MMHPPSLSEDLKARSFRARNGELGVLPSDASLFLAACRADNVEVLGWELWIVDHRWAASNAPEPAEGYWSGGIPTVTDALPVVFAGEGNVDELEQQLAALRLGDEIQPAWLPYIRVNFILG